MKRKDDWYKKYGFYGYVTVWDEAIGQMYTWHPNNETAYNDCMEAAKSKDHLSLVDCGVYQY